MKPSLGRIVLVKIADEDIRVAIIVKVHDDDTLLDLQVFRTSGDGSLLLQEVKKGKQNGEWTWPVKK